MTTLKDSFFQPPCDKGFCIPVPRACLAKDSDLGCCDESRHILSMFDLPGALPGYCPAHLPEPQEHLLLAFPSTIPMYCDCLKLLPLYTKCVFQQELGCPKSPPWKALCTLKIFFTSN